MKQRLTLLLMLVFLMGGYIFGEGSPKDIAIQGRFIQTVIQSNQPTQYIPDAELSTQIEIRNIADGVLWSETQVVPYSEGLFNIHLGQVVPITDSVFSHSNLFLQLTIGAVSATFNLMSAPIAVMANVAETASEIRAESITGTFSNPVTVDTTLTVTPNLFNVQVNPTRVSILKPSTTYTLDVSGNIDATHYQLSGTPITDALTWKTNPSNNAYTLFSSPIGIGTTTGTSKTFAVTVTTLNVSEILINGLPLSSDKEWQKETGNPNNIYFNNLDGLVGIGYVSPKEKVQVRGGLIVADSFLANEGTIRFDGSKFLGRKGNNWINLAETLGGGSDNKIPVIGSNKAIGFDSNLSYVDGKIGIGATSPEALLDIKGGGNQEEGLLHIKDSSNKTVMFLTQKGIGNTTKAIGIGTSNPQQKIDINGTLNSTQLLINGVEFSKSIGSGTFWLRKDNHVYYNAGPVGIGRPDPSATLEIAQPTGRDIDPAIVFSVDNRNIAYTFGVDAQDQGVFKVEKGTSLGDGSPLFVSLDDRFGIGVLRPNSNLHVSGNLGLIISGEFFNFSEFEGQFPLPNPLPEDLVVLPGIETKNPLTVTGNGTRMFFYAAKSAFRAGHLDTDSLLGGDDWNLENLGYFSNALGLNATVTGSFSTVMNGLRNQVGGAYATILGGREGNIQGDFSWGIGQFPQVNHLGNFVYNGSNTPHSTLTENQFLIFAENGTGFNTNNTSFAQLTLSNVLITQNLMQVLVQEEPGIVITTKSFTINTDTPEQATKGLILGNNGRLGLNTTSPNASFDIKDTIIPIPGLARSLLLFEGVENATTSPAFVLNDRGSVGIGTYPTTDNYREVRIASGAIRARSFKKPSGEELSGKQSLVLFNFTNTPNIFFPSGNINNSGQIVSTWNNIGIGTLTPNSLLEIGNINNTLQAVDPLIAFQDNNSQHIYKLGVPVNSQKFQIFSHLAPESQVVISSTGVGFNESSPAAAFHNAGTAIFEEHLAIGGKSISENYSLIVSSANFSTLFLNGTLLSAAGLKWTPGNATGTRIYFDTVDDKFVGIGTTAPLTELEINGNLKATRLKVKDRFQVNGETKLKSFKLAELDGDGNRSNVTASFTVENAYLFLDSSIGKTNISDILTEGTIGSGQTGGNVIFWVANPIIPKDNLLSESDLFWNELSKTLELNGKFILSNNKSTKTGFSLQNQLEVASTNTQTLPETRIGLDFTSSISNNKTRTNSSSYTNTSINVRLVDLPNFDLGSDPNNFIIKGSDVRIGFETPNKSMKNATQVSGIYVDLSNINLQSSADGNPGFKYAGIFKGNVGINTTPSTTLDVSGRVSANSFIISDGLIVSSMRAQSGSTPIFIVNENGQTAAFSEPLNDVLFYSPKPLTSTKAIIRNATANGLLGGNKNFIVQNGLIGVGETQPLTQFNLKKNISTNLGLPFSMVQIDQTLKNNTVLSNNITGVDITFQTEDFNTFGFNSEQTATGLKVALNDLATTTSSNPVGIAVSTNSASTENAFSAIFMGGAVGIGTSQPSESATLHIKGTLYATNLPQARFLTKQQAASFNVIYVTDTLTAPSLYAHSVSANQVNQDSLSVTSSITLPDISLTLTNGVVSTLVSANYASIKQLNNFKILTAQKGILNQVAVGQSNTEEDLALSVTGVVSANTVSISELLSAGSLSISNTLFSNGSNIAIGKADYNNIFNINYSNRKAFTASNIGTWGSIVIQNTATQSSTAAGLDLIPGAESDTGFSLRGISTGNGTTTGSYLAFFDLSDAKKQPILSISESGNIGINTETPLYALEVSGSVNISNTLTTSGSIFTQSISGTTVSIANGTSIPTPDFKNHLKFSEGGQALLAEQLSFIPQTSGLLKVYADSQKDLIYQYKSTTGTEFKGSLLKGVTGKTATRLPVYDNNYKISDNSGITFLSSTTPNRLSISGFMSQLNTANNSLKESKAEKNIDLTFKNRQNINTNFLDTIFTGISIVTTKNTGATKAVLGKNEVAVGLKSDLRMLEDEWQSNSGTRFKGYKTAGQFLGGAVGIGTNLASTPPQAQLHIHQTITDNFALKISDATRTNVAITPTSSTFLGKVPASNRSRLAIGGYESSVLSIQNTDETALFTIKNDKLGILTDSPSEDFVINGATTANAIFAKILKSQSLQVQDYLKTDSTGKVGFNTSSPEAYFHFVHNISKTPSKSIVFENIHTTLNTNLTSQIKGFEISMASITSQNKVGSAVQTANVLGLELNMKDLEGYTSGTQSAVTMNGLVVTVPENATTPNYAALFMGGSVGVNIQKPKTDLDIVGTLKATNLFYSTSGLLELERATVNRLEVLGESSFQSVTGTTFLVPDTLTVDVIPQQIRDEISGKTIQFTQKINATTAFINRINIGGTDPSGNAFYVSGNSLLEGIVYARIISSNLVEGETITINASTVEIDATQWTASGNVTLPQLTLPAKTISPEINKGALYVENSSQKPLIYSYNNNGTTSPFNISKPFQGQTALTLGYFNQGNALVSIPNLKYTPNPSSVIDGTLTLRTNNLAGTPLYILSKAKTTDTSSTAHRIKLLFPSRSTQVALGDTEFTGMSVIAQKGSLAGNSETYETLYGAYVDVSNLKVKTFSIDGEPQIASKYAAIFTGGAVGINTKFPIANLHAVITENHNFGTPKPMKLHSSDSELLWLTDSNGGTVINGSTAKAVLDLRSKASASSENFSIRGFDVTNPVLFGVNTNGKVTFGDYIASANFDLYNPETQTKAFFTVGSSSKSAILHLTKEGFLGLGTASPTHSLQIKLASGENLNIGDGLIVSNNKTFWGFDNALTGDTVSVVASQSIRSGEFENANTDLFDKETDIGQIVSLSQSGAFFGITSSNLGYRDAVIRFGHNPTKNLLAFEDTALTRHLVAYGLNDHRGLGVGIADVNSANFVVKGKSNKTIFNVIQSDNTPVFFVSKNNTISYKQHIGTDELLSVSGDFRVSDGGNDYAIDIKNFNLKANFIASGNTNSLTLAIDKNTTGSTEQTAFENTVSISGFRSKDVYGFKINPYSTLSGGIDINKFTALEINVEDIATPDLDLASVSPPFFPSSNGKIFAAIFNGGRLALTTDKYPQTTDQYNNLNYSALDNFDLQLEILLTTPTGDLRTSDVDRSLKEKRGKWFYFTTDTNTFNITARGVTSENDKALNMYTFETLGDNYPWTIAVDQEGTNATPSIYIGYDPDDEYNAIYHSVTSSVALTVSGDVRIGQRASAQQPESSGYGKKLWFSGAPNTNAVGQNGDNRDPLWMARYNLLNSLDPDGSYSQIRVNVGENNSEDPYAKFTIVSPTSNSDFQSGYVDNMFTAMVTGFEGTVQGSDVTTITPLGAVGIGTTLPLATFHVQAQPDDTNSESADVAGDDKLAVIVDNEYAGGNGILIFYSNATTSGNINDNFNFISFATKEKDPSEPKIKNLLGAIKASTDGSGVTYTAPGADYAEYMKKSDPSAMFNGGEIIGVHKGKVNKNTENADQILVISSRAIIAGNWPGKNADQDYALVSFLGQVPIRVTGPIQAGDYVIASGKNDGLGIGVSSKNLTASQIPNIVGQALESKTSNDTNVVNTLIGFPNIAKETAIQIENTTQLKEEIAFLKKDNQALKSTYMNILETRGNQIDQIKTEIERLKSQL